MISIPTTLLILQYHYQDRDIWLDEYLQIHFSSQRFLAADQSIHVHQPPSDYLLSLFSKMIFGMHKFTVRMNALWSYFLLATLLPLIFLRLFRSKFTVLFGMTAFFINPSLSYFSVEARPTHLAIFWSFIFAALCLVNFHRRRLPVQLMISVAILFSLAIGIQPTIMMLAILITFVINMAIKKEATQLSTVVAILCSQILMVPIYLKMLNVATRLSRVNVDQKMRILNYLYDFHLHNFELYLVQFADRIQVFALVPIGLILSLVWRSRERVGVILWLTSTGALMLIGFDVLFRMYIEWDLFNRYSIVLNSILIFLLSHCFSVLVNAISQKKWKLSIGVAGMILLVLPTNLIIVRSSDATYMGRNNEKFSLMYEYLMAEGTANDVAVYFSTWPLIDYEPNMWISKQIYYNEADNPWLSELTDDSNSGFWYPIVPIERFASGTPFKIFLIINSKNKNKTENLRNGEILKKWRWLALPFQRTEIDDFIEIVTIPVDSLETWKAYLWAIVDLASPEFNGYALFSLLKYAELEDNQAEKEKACQIFVVNDFSRGLKTMAQYEVSHKIQDTLRNCRKVLGAK